MTIPKSRNFSVPLKMSTSHVSIITVTKKKKRNVAILISNDTVLCHFDEK